MPSGPTSTQVMEVKPSPQAAGEEAQLKPDPARHQNRQQEPQLSQIGTRKTKKEEMLLKSSKHSWEALRVKAEGGPMT